MRLVKGATFHDGRPITSEDVAFSLMAVEAFHPFNNTMHAPVERVETPTPDIAIWGPFAPDDQVDLKS